MLPIINSIVGIADKFIVDKNAKLKFESELKSKMEDTFSTALKADKEIKLAELRSGGIASVWRPIAALSVFGTLFLHWFILPLFRFIVVSANLNIYYPELESLPIEYYGLAISFVSIYAYGRSMEKKAINISLGNK